MSGPAETRRIRWVATPERVRLPLEIASAGDRLVAFLIDFVLIHAVVLTALLAGLAAHVVDASGLALSFALVLSFLVRNFYFVFLELRWGGATIGKRRLGLRVVSRDGGPLAAEAVLARNLTRDLEVFVPLAALLQPRALVPSGPGWGVAAALAWLFVLATLPLWNRDRLRVGDLVAGTMVVKAPGTVLLGDLAREEPLPTGWETPSEALARIRFTTAQLDEYGIHELQVLEDVLRARARREALLARVAERIKRRIGWVDGDAPPDDELFLRAFYRAQRERLEQRLLLGERRERKRS